MDLGKIRREDVLKALQEIDRDGIPKGRGSTRFNLIHEGQRYPPKYVVGLAHKLATGEALSPEDYSGGEQTNAVLVKLGFHVVNVNPQSGPLVSRVQRRHRLSVSGAKCIPTTPDSIVVRHNSSCGECKNAIHELLRKVYGTVKREHKIDVSTSLDSYREKSFFPDLERIYRALTEYRGFTDFVGNRSLPNCDFYVLVPGFVVETDEPQHFTKARSVSLSSYPHSLTTGFDVYRWQATCDKLNRKDSSPPSRDETRAWYDTIRDFLPVIRPGLGPTVRLRMGDIAWCKLDPDNTGDVARFRTLLGGSGMSESPSVGTTSRSSDVPQVSSTSFPRSPGIGSGKPEEVVGDMDLSKIHVKVFDEPGARVARVVLTGSLARAWRSMSNPESARVILQKVVEAWPQGHPVDYLITFGGFQRFKWPLPVVGSHDGISWSSMAALASAEAKKCLEGAITNALAGHVKYITIGIDSSSVEHDHSKPEVELVGLFSIDGTEEQWTGKSKPVPAQMVGLMKAPLETHFQTVGNEHIVVLGCHDLNLFSGRAYTNSSPRKKTDLGAFRRKLTEWSPTVVLQHPHTTDSNRTWLAGWSGVRTLSGKSLHTATGGVCYKGSDGKPPRSPLSSVLLATRFGPTLDFVLDVV